MNVAFKYDYLKLPSEPSVAFPRRLSVSRPIIPIQLINGQIKQRCYALIDSGADYCVFHASIGEIIGLTVESDKLDEFSGVAEQKELLKAYFHDIKIEVGGYEFDCWTGFSRDIANSSCGCLGQFGFFSLFNVLFDYNKERLELRLKA